MNQPAAFSASYSDWKLIKTRGVVQVVMEIPLADADTAYNVLGGMPDVARENWFAIAPLKLPRAEKENNTTPIRTAAQPQPDVPRSGWGEAGSPFMAKAKRDWRAVPYPQQAGIRICEATFAAYLREEHPDEWHETGEADACVKFICNINSKRELLTNHKAALLWHQLDTAYSAWLALERA
jgi:hypothetical protein